MTLPFKLKDEEKIKLARDAGFDGIEIISYRNKDDFFRIKDITQKIGIEITSILDLDYGKYPLSSSNLEIRNIALNNYINDLKFASLINVNTVLCVPAIVDENNTYESAYSISFDQMKILAEYAEKYKTTIAIENVWNKFLLSPIEFVDYIDKINSDFVKAYFDCGNICLYGYPHHWIKSLGKRRISKIHVKGFNNYPKTIGFPKTLSSDVPWNECIEALNSIEYQDYLIVEIKDDGIDSVKRVYQYSEELTLILQNKY